MKYTATINATFDVEFEITDASLEAMATIVQAGGGDAIEESMAYGVVLALSHGMDEVNKGATGVFLRPIGEVAAITVARATEVTP